MQSLCRGYDSAPGVGFQLWLYLCAVIADREPEKILPPGIPRILLSESDFHNPDRQDGGMPHLAVAKPLTHSCS